MYVWVHSLMGNHWRGEGLDDHTTVLQLKRRMRMRCGLPPEQQTLTFRQSVLPDHTTLADCRVAEGAALYLTIRSTTGFQMHV